MALYVSANTYDHNNHVSQCQHPLGFLVQEHTSRSMLKGCHDSFVFMLKVEAHTHGWDCHFEAEKGAGSILEHVLNSWYNMKTHRPISSSSLWPLPSPDRSGSLYKRMTFVAVARFVRTLPFPSAVFIAIFLMLNRKRKPEEANWKAVREWVGVLVGHSEKGLAGDWTGAEGRKVLKLNGEPPKIRGYSSQPDTETKNSRTDWLTRGRGQALLMQGFWDILSLKPCCFESVIPLTHDYK